MADSPYINKPDLRVQDLQKLLEYCETEEERDAFMAELDEFAKTELPIFVPQYGPQLSAYESEADILGYGGQAGSGKSGIISGLALTKHERTLIIRREVKQLNGLKDDMARIVGNTIGLNRQANVWRDPVPGKIVEFGSLPNLGDETKWQGQPHDLLCVDEATEVRESQIRFLMGWVRSVSPSQRCRTVFCFNPPTNVEGLWVVRFFAPWIDDAYTGNKALPGELRWFATVNEEDIELADNRPFVIEDGEIVYDFDPDEYPPEYIIKPSSRTFIPAKLTDNIFLGDQYMKQLQGLPEDLRNKMLHGQFTSFMRDDPMAVCPSEWVQAAMDRWTDAPGPKPPMDAMGVDIARGGKDFTEIACRHGWWFARPISHKGTDTPDGPSAAAQVLHARRDDCPVIVDAMGVGSSPVDFLVQWGVHTIPLIVNRVATATDATGLQSFSNIRSQMWWRMRELLDPANGYNIALPNDRQLKEDLTAMTYVRRGTKIYCLSREELVKKIGRSPDRGTAYVQATFEIPRRRQPAKRSSMREEENYWELA